MFCANCGKFVPDESRFCPGCGSPVEAEPAQETPSLEKESWDEQYDSPGYYENEYPKKKKSRLPLVAALCAIAAIICVVAVLFAVGKISFPGVAKESAEITEDTQIASEERQEKPDASGLELAFGVMRLSDYYDNPSFPYTLFYDKQNGFFEMGDPDNMEYITQFQYCAEGSCVFVKKGYDSGASSSLNFYDGDRVSMIKEFEPDIQFVQLFSPSKKDTECIILTKEDSEGEENQIALEKFDTKTNKLTEICSLHCNEYDYVYMCISPNGKKIILSILENEGDDGITILECSPDGESKTRYRNETNISNDVLFAPICCDNKGNLLLINNYDEIYVQLADEDEPKYIGCECTNSGTCAYPVFANSAGDEFLISCVDGIYFYCFGEEVAQKVCKWTEASILTSDDKGYYNYLKGTLGTTYYWLPDRAEGCVRQLTDVATLNGTCFFAEDYIEDAGAFYQIKDIKNGEIEKLAKTENMYFGSGDIALSSIKTNSDFSRVIYFEEDGIKAIDVNEGTKETVFEHELPMYVSHWVYVNNDQTKAIISEIVTPGERGTRLIVVDLEKGESVHTTEVEYSTEVNLSGFEGFLCNAGNDYWLLGYDGKEKELDIPEELNDYSERGENLRLFTFMGQPFIGVEEKDMYGLFYKKMFVLDKNLELVKVWESER